MSWIYAILSSVIALGSLREDFRQSSIGYFTFDGLRSSFIAVSVFTAVFLVFSYLINKLDKSIILSAIMVEGIYIRVCYTLFTDTGTRTYDVYRDSWGHLDYIRYIAENFTLPPVNDCQAYHPPIHHILSAFALNLGKLFTEKEFYQLKAIQLLMVLISSLTLIFFYKILKELDCSKTVAITAVSLFAFHPTNIYFSSRINNDNTLLFFYTLAFYYLVKWLKNSSIKNIILLSFTAAMAVLTKFSGIMLVPIIASAFAIRLFRNRNRSNYTGIYRQYALFGMIFIPFSMSYQLRNYILFNQSFGFVPYLGEGFTPTFHNLFYFPVGNIVRNPFNNGGLVGGEYFMEFFLKSSLFGEWQYPGLEKLASAMILLAIALTVIIAIYLLTICKGSFKSYRLILLLNLIIPVILEMKFRTDLPTACSQDFRYAAPVLLSASFFLGEAVEKLRLSRFRILNRFTAVCTASFCFLSVVFIFSLLEKSQ